MTRHTTTDISNGVMVLTLNRPDKLNAYTAKMGASADVTEGVQAFIERRSPSFPGKASTDMPKGLPWRQDDEL